MDKNDIINIIKNDNYKYLDNNIITTNKYSIITSLACYVDFYIINLIYSIKKVPPNIYIIIHNNVILFNYMNNNGPFTLSISSNDILIFGENKIIDMISKFCNVDVTEEQTFFNSVDEVFMKNSLGNIKLIIDNELLKNKYNNIDLSLYKKCDNILNIDHISDHYKKFIDKISEILSSVSYVKLILSNDILYIVCNNILIASTSLLISLNEYDIRSFIKTINELVTINILQIQLNKINNEVIDNQVEIYIDRR